MKILNPFNLESINVHLVMLLDVFLVYETKFSRKVSSGGLHCTEEERSIGGGDSTLGGIPQAAPD